MGTLSCQRCGATAQGNTQAEADDLIDHGRGNMIGRPCSGNSSDLKWTGTQKATTTTTPTTTPKEAPITETSKSSTKTIRKSKRG